MNVRQKTHLLRPIVKAELNTKITWFSRMCFYSQICFNEAECVVSVGIYFYVTQGVLFFW